MKTVLGSLSITVLIIIVAIACGSNAEVKKVSNVFLGEYPSLLKEYAAKMDKIESEVKEKKESKDIEALLKLAKDKKELENEYKTKVDEYAKSFGFNKDIPLETLSGNPYTIIGMKVKTATANALALTLNVVLNQDIKTEYGGIARMLIIYFKAVDKDNKVISKSYTNAYKSNTDLKSGSKFDLNLSWNSDVAKNFENFVKVIQVTESEYKSNK